MILDNSTRIANTWGGGKAHISLGIFFLGLLVWQYYFPFNISLFERMQKDDIYKQLTGLLLVFYVAGQWRLAHARGTKKRKFIRQRLLSHKWLGSIAPIFIFIHATTVGYAYQRALSIVFLLIVLTGLLNYHELKIKNKLYISVWTVLHVSLATSFLALLGFHIYVSYIYS